MCPTAELLQKPSIIDITGSTITVAHPDISGYTRHYLRSQVTTVSSLTATFTAAITDIITSATHGLATGNIVVFTTTTTLPAGLSLATNYYVKYLTANTFNVSTTYNGTNVDITDTGTGTHTFTVVGTTSAVDDNLGLEDNDWFVLGEIGDAKTEDDDVNGTVTRGTALPITNNISFAHDISTPVTKILERGIAIYGTDDDGVTGTIIESIGAITASGTQLADATMIQWNRESTEYTMITTDTTYEKYYVVFTDGTTESAISDCVAAAGLGSTAIQNQVDSALEMCDEEINETGKITRKFLLNQSNQWQDTVSQYIYTNERGTRVVKDWAHELVSNDTSITSTENENEYALSGLTYALKYPDSKQGILNVRFGTRSLEYIDPAEMDKNFTNIPVTQVKTAITVADTSIVLDSTYEFSESGTVYIGEDTISYTGNTEATGTLTGCTDVDNDHAVDDNVWQNIQPGLPRTYTIFNGKIIVNVPIDTDYVGYAFKFKYLKALTRFSDFSDTTDIPFYNTLETFLRARIEIRKGNRSEGDKIMEQFEKQLARNAASQFTPVMEEMTYHTFNNDLDNGRTNLLYTKR